MSVGLLVDLSVDLSVDYFTVNITVLTSKFML